MAVLAILATVSRVNRSRALRFVVAVAVLAATALLADSALATSSSEQNLETLNHQVLAAVNRFRVAHGLVALRESAALDSSARRHSLEMGRHGLLRPLLGRRDRVLAADPALLPGGWPFVLVGRREPGLGRAEPERREAMQLWIASPPHLANLLTRQWRRIGVSAVSVAHAPGVYGGGRVIDHHHRLRRPSLAGRRSPAPGAAGA